MRTPARLAIGAVALAAGVAVFWVSISMWTRDRLNDPAILSGACLHPGEAARLHAEPRYYLASVVVDVGYPQGGPPRIPQHIGRLLVRHFGFLLVSHEEQVRLVDSFRICGQPPA